MKIPRERCNFYVIPMQKSVIPVQITKDNNFVSPCLRLDLNTFSLFTTENDTGTCEVTDLV